jgi:hypothetical protein
LPREALVEDSASSASTRTCPSREISFRGLFDRLVARLNETATDRWLLKGGFALDLRLSERTRFTRDVDIDIEWRVADEELLDALIEAAGSRLRTTSRRIGRSLGGQVLVRAAPVA